MDFTKSWLLTHCQEIYISNKMNMLNSVTKQPKGTVSAIAMKSNDNSADISPIWKWSHVENDFYTNRIIKTESKIWFGRNGSSDCLCSPWGVREDDIIYFTTTFGWHHLSILSFFKSFFFWCPNCTVTNPTKSSTNLKGFLFLFRCTGLSPFWISLQRTGSLPTLGHLWLYRYFNYSGITLTEFNFLWNVCLCWPQPNENYI